MGGPYRMGNEKAAFWILMSKSLSRRPPGMPRREWDDNIKQNQKQEKGCEQSTCMEFAKI